MVALKTSQLGDLTESDMGPQSGINKCFLTLIESVTTLRVEKSRTFRKLTSNVYSGSDYISPHKLLVIPDQERW